MLMGALGKELASQLNRPANNETKRLFEEWRAAYAQVADISRATKNAGVPLPWEMDTGAEDRVACLLFVMQTYTVLLAKFLAAKLVCDHGLCSRPRLCENLLALKEGELLDRWAHDVEQGALFAEAGLRGFIAPSAFSWYAGTTLTAEGKSNMAQGLRSVVGQLALYGKPCADSTGPKDLTKAFYQALVPAALRKALGEFYTPGWLVDITCDRAEVSDWLAPRVLDPACGSGAFLLEALRRKRAAAERAGLGPRETLKHVLDTVWGFDLNPLAVQCARLNYLLAIVDLLAATKMEVQLPILLTDAVCTPQGGEARKAGEFDLIAGNPPGCGGPVLPRVTETVFGPMPNQYGIFSDTPYHGGNELDISAVLTYTAGDRWLSMGGTLVFVITQTHFQAPSSQGFRNFRIHEDANFSPVSVDDLKSLKPFAGVSNKTAILRLKKVGRDERPVYPIPYRVWKLTPARGGAITEHLSKNQVLERVQVKHWEATPVNGGDSPWAVLPPGRFRDLDAIRGACTWLAGRKGVATDLNGVYMVRITGTNKNANLVQVTTRPHAGRASIGKARRFWVEPDLLYPLLKGAADFSACAVDVKDNLFVFIPNTGITQAAYAQAMQAIGRLPHTGRFFRSHKNFLQQRSTYRLRQQGAPYYAIYNVGAYTFAPYKVIWAELSTRFESAVAEKASVPLAGERVLVPDHKVYFADFSDMRAAYFVCGLLNSSLVKEFVASHTIQIQVGNIFKHLRLPEFRSSDSDHRSLSRLCLAAHAQRHVDRKAALLQEVSALGNRILLS